MGLAVPGEQQLLAVGVEALADQAQVAALGAAGGQQALAAGLGDAADAGAVRVVEVDDGGGALREDALEEAELGPEVGLEVRVVVEVVAADVGEAGGGEVDAVEAELVEAVRGGLHRRVGDALVGELGEQAVQGDRLGGGVAEPGRDRALDADGAEVDGGLAERLPESGG